MIVRLKGINLLEEGTQKERFNSMIVRLKDKKPVQRISS